MSLPDNGAPFPAELLNWAGNRSGGVRRLFDDTSGRPDKAVLVTNLLSRLEAWVEARATKQEGTPRAILLVGGPGNGKTEAIESTVRGFDDAIGAGGRLMNALSKAFSPPDGLVPRIVTVDLDSLVGRKGVGVLSIVQDASVQVGDKSGAQCLLEELPKISGPDSNEIYLCCVNRGVLDDALIEAIDTGADEERKLLETVTRAVSLFPNAPSCWPLEGFVDFAVWPMDVESLFVRPVAGEEPPADKLLNSVLDERRWMAAGTCPAGAWCPFCGSHDLLRRDRERQALLSILRWYEVSSGKRWSFRDLFSLVSYLLAGHRPAARDAQSKPCEWAASLAEADKQAQRQAKPLKESSSAIFHLVAAQYQHALFHHWDRDSGASLLRDIKELGLADDNTAMGLHWFLASRRGQYLPTIIGTTLAGLARTLDPALASPETNVQVSQRTAYQYRDLDVRFSRSVSEGLQFVRRHQIIAPMEIALLERLEQLDGALSQSVVRRKRPATATRVQRLVRDFAGRLVRRTIGTRTGDVLDAQILAEFQRVTEDAGGDEVYDVAREVERLLNTQQDFEVSLTTTFGQPLPPPIQRATLVVPARQVKPLEELATDRPKNPIAYLKVGGGASSQPFALTYELFKAVKELRDGMSVASLPRGVLALLDTTRAKLSGPIVRDPDVLARAIMRIGSGGVVVEERRQGFVSFKEPSR